MLESALVGLLVVLVPLVLGVVDLPGGVLAVDPSTKEKPHANQSHLYCQSKGRGG